ncbi:MAG: Fe-S cluster assembly protein SufD [Ignavibacteria bacterium]|nr:Fe-S cluster assembly protein SufD [Ignavibacteria bacterium]MBI3765665.1 Fe-S cluster assembly protein SufD [Ignavibacteriales bacterium]
MNGSRLVFINGHFSRDLSDCGSFPHGVKVENLSGALKNDIGLVNQYLTRYARYDDNAFTALNTGFLHDGAFIYVPEGIVIEDPIYLVFVSTESDASFVSHPRNLIVVSRNAQVCIVEHYISVEKNSYFTNTVTEIVAGDHSVVEHTKLQSESLKAFHIGSMYVHQGPASNFTSNSISFGGVLARNNITALLDAEGCECTLNGLTLSTGQQHIDNHTTIDHAKPHCNSHELYKAILDGKSKGVFNGKIYVRKDAQKTDAKQTNKTLLLSDNATMNTKPQLEIFADDVKCTHGATVGYLDAEALFYLRSRGIDSEAARDMLTYAFASDVTDRVKIEGVREYLSGVLHARLEQGRSEG